MKKVLTEEQKKSILNDYENTKTTTAEIAVKYAISPSAVSYTVRTMGGEMRVKKDAEISSRNAITATRLSNLTAHGIVRIA